MKKLLRDPRLYFTIWILLAIAIVFMIESCTTRPLIEKGDIVQKCVIDSVKIMESRSTIEPEKQFKYYTSNGTEFTSTERYMVGDTITYIFKNK